MTVGVASLPVVVPVVAVLGAISAITFRCQPFFMQERCGHDERPFRILKIRSLPKNFPAYIGKHDFPEDDYSGWTRVLRRSHLDEVPQVLNVITGTMSVVGPRPMIDEVVDTLGPAHRQTRAQVRTGLTGPWQVSSMGDQPLNECPQLDLQYVEQATFRSDLKLLWLTVMTVLGRDGADPVELTHEMGWVETRSSVRRTPAGLKSTSA